MGYADISANESSNAIIVTDSQKNIKRIAEIVSALDRSMSTENQIKIYPLKYAEAKTLEQIVNRVFKNYTRPVSLGETSAPKPKTARPAAKRPGAVSSSVLQPTVIAVADQETNSLVVHAPQEFMGDIATMLGDLDQPTDDDLELKVFYLENSTADVVGRAVTTLFSTKARQGKSSKGKGRPSGAFGASVQVAVDTRSNAVVVNASAEDLEKITGLIAELDQVLEEKQEMRVFPIEYAEPATVAKIITSTFAGGRKSKSVTNAGTLSEGEVKVTADQHSGSLVVTASKSDLEQVAQLIDELDVKEVDESQVFVYKIENADLEQLKATLEAMFGNGKGAVRKTGRGKSSNSRNSKSGNKKSGRK